MPLAPTPDSRVPPGFARTLTVGEVPLMASNNHNKHPDAPRKGKETYTMLLPTAATADGVRGYHALRFLKLRRLHGRSLYQRYCLFLGMSIVGLLLLLWNDFTFPVLLQLQQLRQSAGAEVSSVDIERCGSLLFEETPRVYAKDAEISLVFVGRRELLGEALQKETTKAADVPFKRALSRSQHEGLLGFFESLMKVMNFKGVRWALGGSSLLGSLERHDILPMDKTLTILVNEEDKQKLKDTAAAYAPMSDIFRAGIYVPQSLFSWIATTNTKIKFEEQALNSPFGLLHLDTSKATDGLHFPDLRVKVYWYSEKFERPAAAPEDWEPHVQIGGGRASVSLPASEWGPFVKRPLGLLVMPSPRNPLYYLTLFYKSRDPLCSVMLQQETAAAAAAAAGERSSGGNNFLSMFSIPQLRCSRYRHSLKSSGLPFVEITQTTPECLKESFVLNGETQLEVYTSSRYTRAPQHASWLDASRGSP